MRSATELLRASPQESPRVRLQMPAPRPAHFPVAWRIAVAAIAVAAAAGSLVGSTLQRPASRPVKQAPQVSLLTNDAKQLRQLKGQREPQFEPGRRGGPPEGVI